MKLYDEIRKQKNIRRWSTHFMLRADTVAEHVHNVSYLALKIGLDHPKEVDLKLLLAKAIMHDAEESIMGDLIYRFKHYNKDVEKFVDIISNKIFEKEYGEQNPSTAEFFKEDKSVESEIVKFCDYLDALFTLIDDFKLGNKHNNAAIERQYKAMFQFKNKIFKEYLKEIRNIYDKEYKRRYFIEMI